MQRALAATHFLGARMPGIAALVAVTVMTATEARAFWLREPGVGEIRLESLDPPGPGEALVKAVRSGVSRGSPGRSLTWSSPWPGRSTTPTGRGSSIGT